MVRLRPPRQLPLDPSDNLPYRAGAATGVVDEGVEIVGYLDSETFFELADEVEAIGAGKSQVPNRLSVVVDRIV
jgi:hypothetical protein